MLQVRLPSPTQHRPVLRDHPRGAALVAVLDPSGLDAVHQVQGWLAAHQPRVLMEVGAPPNL